MSSFNLLNLGVQGTQANKTTLSVIGQNITNVNTPGYNRQIANLTTLENQRGVEVQSITRVTNDFLTRQLWADTAAYGRTDVFADMASELDDRLATGSTSVSTAMDNYFKALQNSVDDPTSLPNRELFVAESEALARRFNDLNSVVMRQNDTVNSNLESVASQVTRIANDIADLNSKIAYEKSSNRPANELRDQRDQMIVELSELIDVRVVEQDSDEFSVFVANGEPLVIGGKSNELISVQGDPDRTKNDLALVIAGSEVDISTRVTGGKLGGLLEYRSEVLDPTINELGRIAIAVSETMNNQHKLGMDLDGNLGGLIFNDVNSQAAMTSRLMAVEGNTSNIKAATVEITDVGKLSASDYEISFISRDDFTIERLSDGKRLDLNQLTKVTNADDLKTTDNAYFEDFDNGKVEISIDGVRISMEVTNKFSRGDRFLVQPTRMGAEQFDTVVTDGRQLALASPIRITESADNKGTGEASVKITDIGAATFQSKAGEIKPPVDIVFSNDSPVTFTVYDMTNPNAPVPHEMPDTGPMVDQLFTPGQAIVLDGYEIEIRNQPVAGDRFSFGYNTGGVSDNSNALQLSNLQLADTVDGGSYQDIYGRLIERVGTKTSVAVINRDASNSVLTATQESKSALSGVNLDEEAAKLVQFQQAYTASAQLISTSQKLFDTLIGSIG